MHLRINKGSPALKFKRALDSEAALALHKVFDGKLNNTSSRNKLRIQSERDMN